MLFRNVGIRELRSWGRKDIRPCEKGKRKSEGGSAFVRERGVFISPAVKIPFKKNGFSNFGGVNFNEEKTQKSRNWKKKHAQAGKNGNERGGET